MRHLVGAMVVLLTLGSSGRAQVSCSDPDNLCTGDPCVIATTVEVISPCSVDFGSRTLVVRGRVHVPDGGALDFTAGAIVVEVRGGIDGSNVSGLGEPSQSGADITLTAAGAITVDGEVKATGNAAAGTITIQAGDTLTVSGRVRADGTTYTNPAGHLILRGAGGVTIDGLLRASGSGTAPASVDIASSGGNVTVNQKIRISAITVHANGNALIDGDLRAYWFVDVSSAVGNVTVNRSLRAMHVSVDAGADLVLIGKVKSRDGTIDLAAAGHAQVGPSAKLDVSGEDYGRLVRVEAGSVDIMGTVRANGRSGSGGGDVRVRAVAGDLVLNGSFIATPTGVIEGSAADAVTAVGRFRSGCNALSAGGTLDVSGAQFEPPLVADCPGSPSGAFLAP